MMVEDLVPVWQYFGFKLNANLEPNNINEGPGVGTC